MVTSSTPMGNVDLEQAETWLSILHSASEGLMHVCSTASWAGRTFSADTSEGHEAAIEYIRQLDASGVQGIYLRATTLMRPLGPGERGSDDDSCTFPGFWADIDIAGPGHKTKKILPPDVDAAMSIVAESGLPEPTYWIHSGGGLYPWWLLDNPIDFSTQTAEILTRTQDLSARWHELLQVTAERLGYSYGPVGDLSRVLRIPGTLNRKIEGEPRPCRILEDRSSSRLYSARDLAQALEAGEARALELAPQQPTLPTPPRIPAPRRPEDGKRPGDAMMEQVSWEEILEPAGYQFDRTHGVETFWVRPGKNRRDGHSCTTNYGGSDLMWVFSTEMDGFESNQSYSKFATWSILNGYGLDFRAATKALASQGYGSQRQPTTPPQPFQPSQVPDGGGQPGEPDAPRVVHGTFHLSDVGNARRLAATHGDKFRYVGLQGEWMRWNGRVWEVDDTSAVNRAAVAITESILEEAEREQQPCLDEHPASKVCRAHHPDAKVCRCHGCTLHKHGVASQADGKIKAMVSQFSTVEGIAAKPDSFDRLGHLVTTREGVLNLRTRELGAFNPQLMLTRKINATYNPQATAPRFLKFLEQVLPSAEMRDYIQRAVGYSLTGENSERALFLLHGPSGSGKSQFLTIMESLFGDFGGTAESTTFRESRSEATNNLHTLRGKRFVTTSETSDSSKLDEELVKRITGGDCVTTRELYQKNVTWRPEFTIWMATNFPPKMDSDDGAIWARYKPIHFGQQFSTEQGNAVKNLGRAIFEAEADGILNWVLEGLAAYETLGLGEPGEVKQTVAEHKMESDNVAQFVQDAVEEGILVAEPTGRVRSLTLYQVYDGWCQRQRVRPYGQKRFSNRMRALEYEQVKDSVMYWVGLSTGIHQGLLGRMG